MDQCQGLSEEDILEMDVVRRKRMSAWRRVNNLKQSAMMNKEDGATMAYTDMDLQQIWGELADPYIEEKFRMKK